MEALIAQLAMQFGPVLYMALAPFVTELLKMAAAKIMNNVPKQAIPIMGTVAGAIVGGIAQAIDPNADLTFLNGLTPLTGAVAGMAGTGVHQTVYAEQYERKRSRET